MIILPEDTVREWGECVTAAAWADLSNNLLGAYITAYIAGRLVVADDWRMLSDLAMMHAHDVGRDEVARIWEAA